MKILVSAYAVCPGKGSEPGVGWNWLREMACSHNIEVITEAEFRDQIEPELDRLGLRDRLHFHYLDIGEAWRVRCWNQGDWRFYGAYRRWQKQAFLMSVKLLETHRFDLVHQLCMVGYREPGFLWKLNLPYVWGPVGGAGNVPLSLLRGQSLPFQAFNFLKNMLNRIQLIWGGRPSKAARRAGSGFFASTHENARLFHNSWGTPVQHIEEVGPLSSVEVSEAKRHLLVSDPFRIFWAGHFDSRKALHLLIEALAEIDEECCELHVLGDGALESQWKDLASRLLVNTKVVWHGRLSRTRSLEVMASCQIVAITSLKEENSSVTFEALSLGIPVVCLELSGMATVINKSCGVLIPVRSSTEVITAIGCAIRHLKNDPEVLKSLSVQAQLRAQELSWKNKMIQLSAIYQNRLQEAGKN